MIFQGKDGCVCIYWDELLIAGFPLGKYNLDDYRNDSERLIMDSLRHGHSIASQTKSYNFVCKSVHYRKKNKRKISTEDLQMFFCSLLALIRFKIIDEEDVIFIAPRRK